MVPAKWTAALLAALLCVGISLQSAELTDAERQRATQLVQNLGDADPAKRAAAETELRGMGAKVLPVLRQSTVPLEIGQERLRAIVVDMTVSNAGINPTDAANLSSLGREEALSKRYENAYRCYHRAEKIYDKLKDDADDMDDDVKEQQYKVLENQAEKRADRAKRLSKGKNFSGLNLGIVRIGVDHDNREDDW
jgi:hypothetical protein